MIVLATTEVSCAVKFTTEVSNALKLVAVKVRTNRAALGASACAIALTSIVILGSYEGLFGFMGETAALLNVAEPAPFTAQSISAFLERAVLKQSKIKKVQDF